MICTTYDLDSEPNFVETKEGKWHIESGYREGKQRIRENDQIERFVFKNTTEENNAGVWDSDYFQRLHMYIRVELILQSTYNFDSISFF